MPARDTPAKAAKRARYRADAIAAAEALFAEHGVEGTTVDAIAAAAGIAPRTFYTVFDSKQALVEWIAERHRDELMRRGKASIKGVTSAWEALVATVEVSTRYYLENPDHLRHELRSSVFWGDERSARSSTWGITFRSHTGLFQRAIAEGAVRQGDPAAHARAMLALQQSQMAHWVAGGMSAPHAEVLDAVTDLVAAAFIAPSIRSTPEETPMNPLLAEKTVLITGVGVGLGVETAKAALAAGANVVIGARKADRIAATAADLDPSGERVLAHPVDIGDVESIAAFVAAAKERFGSVDVAVQVAANEDAFGGLHEAPVEKWTNVLDTNVIGALKVVQEVSKVMAEQGSGSIVLIGSQSSFKPALPQAGYGASKGALLSAMYYWADELGPAGIRVNTVVPGWMWGPNVEMLVDWNASQAGRSQAEELADMTASYPMRRMAEDGEVAKAVVFFASDLASGVTGQHLMVNCGDMMA